MENQTIDSLLVIFSTTNPANDDWGFDISISNDKQGIYIVWSMSTVTNHLIKNKPELTSVMKSQGQERAMW